MAWEVEAGTVFLGMPHEGLGEPMSALAAASKVDDWFPRYDPILLPKLEEIVRTAGGTILRTDGDELRELVKRALYDGRIVAFARRSSAGGGSICKAPEPPPKPIKHDRPVCETESLRFHLLTQEDCQPIAHAKVTIELEDGTRTEAQTDANGEVYFSCAKTTQFTLVSIDEPFGITAIENKRG